MVYSFQYCNGCLKPLLRTEIDKNFIKGHLDTSSETYYMPYCYHCLEKSNTSDKIKKGKAIKLLELLIAVLKIKFSGKFIFNLDRILFVDEGVKNAIKELG